MRAEKFTRWEGGKVLQTWETLVESPRSGEVPNSLGQFILQSGVRGLHRAESKILWGSQHAADLECVLRASGPLSKHQAAPSEVFEQSTRHSLRSVRPYDIESPFWL